MREISKEINIRGVDEEMKKVKRMRKRMLSLICAFAMLTGILYAPVPVGAVTTEDSVFEMKTASNSLNEGDTVEVTLHVHNMDIYGFSAYLDYDTSVFETLTAGQLVPAESPSSGESGGSWSVSCEENTFWQLDVNWSGSSAAEMSKLQDGKLLTIRLKVKKSVTSTTIGLNYLKIYKGRNQTQPQNYSSVKLTIDNSKARKLTMATEDVSGNSVINVPVKLNANDGFSELQISADFDSKQLVFDSVSLDKTFQDKVTKGAYTVSNGGNTVSVTFTATEDNKTTGTLCYLKFHALNQSTTQKLPVYTPVKLYVGKVQDKDKSAFVLSDVTSNVTITEKERAIGDVNGNGGIDLVDALYILRHYNKVRTLSDLELSAADVNKNGSVDLVDAVIIMQYYNGVIKSF